MHAIVYDRFGAPDVLEFRSVATPEPVVGEIRVALQAASVIPGDTKLRAGHLKALFPISFPKIPGRDGAGVVERVGSGVTAFKVGDRVCVVTQHTEPGTYAQYVTVHESSAVFLPESLDFSQGAALMHAGVCAWICLVETGHIKRDMRVLIHAGSGAIGGMAVQLAHHLGAYVASTCRAVNAAYVKHLGADEVIAYDEEDFSSKLSGYDLVIDLVGGATHEKSYRVLKRGGQMVCLITTPFVDRSAEFGVRTTMARIDDSPDVLASVVKLASQGVLVPQICKEIPLSDAKLAHEELEAGLVSRGRIVLRIPQNQLSPTSPATPVRSPGS